MSLKKLLTATLAFFAMQLAEAGVAIEHWVTPSGARVYFVASRVLPMLDVQVDFAAGSMFDPADKSGLAALTRAVLDLGAGSRDESDIAEQLADLGATLAGGADTDRASISLRTLSALDKRSEALDVLRAVLQEPRFDDAVVVREQARTIASLKDAATRPDAIAGKAFWAAMYPKHPYGRQATPESVATLSREDLLAFHARYYNAANATITLVGDLSRAEAEAVAESLAAGLPQGEAAVLPAPPQKVRGKVTKIAHPASQAHVYIGLPAVERGNPDYFPLLVGNYTLGGGGFVSRLMQEVRERRGLSYGVHSYFLPLAQQGPFEIGMQTQKSQTDEALRVVRDTLADFIRTGPTESELQAAKDNLIGGFALRLDTNLKILDQIATIGFYRLPLDYLDTWTGNVARVNAREVQAAFRRKLGPERLATVIVGAP